MNSNIAGKWRTRREMLQLGSGLVGTSLISGLLPWGTSAAMTGQQQSGSAPIQNAPISQDRVAQMRAQAATVPVQTQKLRDNVYMLSGPGGNILVLTGADGKLMVDSSFAGAVPKINTALAAIDSKPLNLLINTHWHFDHADGNDAFHTGGAAIVAHENCRKRLSTPQEIAAFQMHFDAAPVGAWPRTTFNDKFALYYDGEQVDLGYILPAHTDGDSIVYFRHANVMQVGDVPASLRYNNIGVNEGGSVDGMIVAGEQVMKIANENTKIIPGHLGPVIGFQEIQQQLAMFRAVRDRVLSAIRAGKTMEEVVASKPTADFDLGRMGGAITNDRFVALVYTDLSRRAK